MAFYEKKYIVMHLGFRNHYYNYTMGGFALGGQVFVESVVEKDMSVFVDNNLKLGQQCAQAAKKASQDLSMIARVFYYCDKYTWVKLYKTYLRCHIDYCIHLWYPWQLRDIDVLGSMQKRAIKIIFGLEGSAMRRG